MTGRASQRSGLAALPPRLVFWAFAVITVLPFSLLVLTSLKSQKDLIGGAFSLPSALRWENYVSAWVDGHFGTYLFNSIVVVVPVVAASVVLGIVTGFGFAFLSLPLKRTLSAILVFGLMVPTEAFIIPLYYEVWGLGLSNSYAALIVPQIAMSVPFATLFMASAMQQLPREMLEAAIIDGASRPTVLWRIIVPLLGPATSTLGLFLFIWTWNEFLIPLILVNDDAVRTLPVGMLFFQGRYTINIPVLTAGAVITISPIVVVYLIFQRRFIEGLTAGAVK